MIDGLKPYPKMKDSGVPWLGEVPEHWELRRTKTLLRERVEKGHPDQPLLAATQSKGVVRKEQYENRTVLALKDLHLLKLVRVGDFVISLRSFQGGIEYAREQGIISPAYTILYPTRADMHGYLARLFKSAPYIENLSLYVTGIRQGQNIDYEKLARTELPLPPLPEQVAIVRFLDYVDRRIRRYIRAKQKLIKLLEEQKQAIIHRAVTRGLDPNVRLKPSGVEWLGDVPEHWEVRKLGSLFQRRGSGTTPSGDHYYGGEIPWVMTGDLNDGLVNTTKRTVTNAAVQELSALQVYQRGALIVAMYGATIGKTGVLLMEACTNQACCVLAEPSESVSVGFLQAVVKVAKPHLIEQSYGGGQPNINAEIVRSLRVPVPPRSEQEEILRAIAEHSGDSAMIRAAREIELIREYRTRLIADVVTGKLDVREAAMRLPDEGEPLDEIESDVEADEAGVDDTDEVPEEAEA
jgi:type I restriction enzyme S subunit